MLWFGAGWNGNRRDPRTDLSHVFRLGRHRDAVCMSAHGLAALRSREINAANCSRDIAP